MKIFQLIYSLSAAGAEKVTVDLSNELSKSNEVYLCIILKENIQFSFLKSQLNEKVNYINLKCSKGNNLKTFLTIFKLINKIKPDVIHAHLNTILYLYLPALVFKNKIKFIHTLHSIAPKTIGYRWQKIVNRIFYKKNLINAIAISQICKTSFIEFYGHQNIVLIENGVSKVFRTNKFNEVKKELNNLKCKESDRIFIHIGRFSKPKNQKLLISVFNRMIKEGHGIILIVVGPGFDSYEAEMLKKNSNKNIHYLNSKSNISDYLFNSDIFVLSSLWEGLPISLLEAISCGIVPVCTPAGGIPDVILDENYGYISNDFSEKGLYDAALKCLSNIDQFDRLNLINYFNSEFSIERCAKRYGIIYQRKN